MLSLLWAVFMIIVAIVLLNVLIAIISDSFARLSAMRIPNWRLQKTQLVLSSYAKLSEEDQDYLGSYLKRNPYLQVLTPTAALQDADAEDWEEKVQVIITGVTAAVKADVVTSMQSSSNASGGSAELSSVKADVALMQADMKSARAEVAALQSSVNKTHELLAAILAGMRQSDKQ
jgi:ABC-type uncharacterized transport system substrate-binding protein